MKHTYYVILALLLVVALAVPAFASDVVYTYRFNGDWTVSANYVAPSTNISTGKRESGYIIVQAPGLTYTNVQWIEYSTESGKWVLHRADSSTASVTNNNMKSTKLLLRGTPVTQEFYDWASLYLVGASDSASIEEIITYCDGSSCPATDADHDNICDDCGAVLTMSLRSDLYQYATSYTDSYTGHNPQYAYRIITKDSESRYSVFISASPGTYNSATDTLTFSDGKQTFVTEKADGSFVGDGWAPLTSIANAMSFRDTIYYSNYTIEGFFPPPLWETMGQVTQGEMGALTQKTAETASILVLCGVGCLALLILLHLLGKKSQIFHL